MNNYYNNAKEKAVPSIPTVPHENVAILKHINKIIDNNY